MESFPRLLLSGPIQSDNGGEFLNDQLKRFAEAMTLEFTRSRPYRKNAHVERNRQFVCDIGGYDRYDTPEQAAWLNQVYAVIDSYANLFLPTRKVVAKHREVLRYAGGTKPPGLPIPGRWRRRSYYPGSNSSWTPGSPAIAHSSFIAGFRETPRRRGPSTVPPGRC